MVPVPAGARISIDTVGLHYNRKARSVQKTLLESSLRVVSSAVLGRPVQFQTRQVFGSMEQRRFCPILWGGEGLYRTRVCYTLMSKSRDESDYTDYRFFEATGLAVLTVLIQHYKIEPHPEFSGEPFERLKDRYSQAKEILTLT